MKTLQKENKKNKSSFYKLNVYISKYDRKKKRIDMTNKKAEIVFLFREKKIVNFIKSN
jgi:hypothetical protein